MPEKTLYICDIPGADKLAGLEDTAAGELVLFVDGGCVCRTALGGDGGEEGGGATGTPPPPPPPLWFRMNSSRILRKYSPAALIRRRSDSISDNLLLLPVSVGPPLPPAWREASSGGESCNMTQVNEQDRTCSAQVSNYANL